MDLGPVKGKWKRVIAGRFETASQARALAEKIKMKLPYCRTVDLEKKNQIGLHLASYRSLEKATSGVRQIQEKLGFLITDEPFSIRRVDLGPGKGVWYRILAGNFENMEAAAGLKQTLDRVRQYARPISL